MSTTVPLVAHCQQKARDILERMRQLTENMKVEREKEVQEEQLRRCKEETSKGLELGKEEQLRRSKITLVEAPQGSGAKSSSNVEQADAGHVAKKMRLGKMVKAMCVSKKDLMLVGRRSAKASSSQDNEVAL